MYLHLINISPSYTYYSNSFPHCQTKIENLNSHALLNPHLVATLCSSFSKGKMVFPVSIFSCLITDCSVAQVFSFLWGTLVVAPSCVFRLHRPALLASDPGHALPGSAPPAAPYRRFCGVWRFFWGVKMAMVQKLTLNFNHPRNFLGFNKQVQHFMN